MKINQKYVISSLELHLFFARIMKEHALFLRAGFTPKDVSYSRRAESFQNRFGQLLMEATALSDCVITPGTLNSGEIITPFTRGAEEQTQCLTGFKINQAITLREMKLRASAFPCITEELARKVCKLNRTLLALLDDFIAFKEQVLEGALTCRMFTMNYPLLIEHILREAKLYRKCLMDFEAGRDFDCQSMGEAERFWNQIMMEHALFIRGLLDPAENDLIAAADEFAVDYAMLLDGSAERCDQALGDAVTLEETKRFRDYKQAGTAGLQACEIRSVILPLLADHILREANHYIRLLER